MVGIFQVPWEKASLKKVRQNDKIEQKATLESL